ncbi:MAG TPA: alanine racemase C-terminal domain-containing protein, partial [Fluviicola sp.]|nr:alanine racemase C-terminal domain-containing protein [Fluviicola sp.]
QKQLDNFNEIIHFFRNNLSVPFTAHILNSEGSLRYSSHAYDMVRIGISMYGYTENEALKGHFEPSVRWYSAVSQVKTIPAGDCVGYGCSFKADKLTQIAIVPVGYADGFKRNLSNGNGAVYIRGYRCEVIGKVCMDMIMVNVTNLGVQPNDKVEIIGINQPMEQLAAAMQTIPYEVMTGLSNRMHRLYINE